MKRALILILLFVATVAGAHDGWTIVVRHDNETYINGHFDDGDVDDLKQRYGRNFAVFERDGETYLVTDAASIQKLRDMFRPQSELGRKQGELGRQQGELGREQGRLGQEQGRLGREQGRLARERADESRMEALAARQRELSAAQRELGARQRELGARQRELGRRQSELAREIDRDLERFISQAVKNGTAKKR